MEARNASSPTSAFDLLAERRTDPQSFSSDLGDALDRIVSASQVPGAYAIAPHLGLRSDNHSVFHRQMSSSISDALAHLSTAQPRHRSLKHYCRARARHKRLGCLNRTSASLATFEVLFVVLTTSSRLITRGGLMATVLQRQNASYAIFSDEPNHTYGVRGLPVSAALERVVHGRDDNDGRRTMEINFIAQKHLELLHTLSKDARTADTKWYVILDDDSFVFVDAFVQTLSWLDASEPILAGGAKVRSNLCAGMLCDVERFKANLGFAPIVHALAGGTGYAISASGLQRIGQAIERRRCLDAATGDVATAACARIASVRLVSLPGGWFVNDPGLVTDIARQQTRAGRGKADDEWTIRQGLVRRMRFSGALVSVHKLNNRTAVCWAVHGSCDAQCDCRCPCPVDKARVEPPCVEPPLSTCRFACPTPTDRMAALLRSAIERRGPVDGRQSGWRASMQGCVPPKEDTTLLRALHSAKTLPPASLTAQACSVQADEPPCMRGRSNSSCIPPCERSPKASFPDFFVIGEQKCATSTLYQWLVMHPHVLSPSHPAFVGAQPWMKLLQDGRTIEWNRRFGYDFKEPHVLHAPSKPM